MDFDLTCIITGHREGYLATASLRSFWRAIEMAEKDGYRIQPLLFLDRPDRTTEAVFNKAKRSDSRIKIVDFGDQGHVRNEAVILAQGRYTAFLDADDLWSKDWLVQSLRFLADRPATHIAHPAYNYFFEEQATIFCHIDQESPEFDLDLLRVANYWDALCVCPTEIHREFPYYTRDLANGWAYEDWYWNCETVVAGKIHKIVPKSVIFKRRQRNSQTVNASKNRSWIKKHGFSSYLSQMYDENVRLNRQEKS